MPFLIRVPAVIARRLVLLTLLYLALPLAIFLLGWLRPLWGVPITLLLMATLLVLMRRGWSLLSGEEAPSRQERRALMVGILWTWLPVALMVLQIGAGGFGAPTEDWENKHNLIFADLVRFSWPVVYHGAGTPAGGLIMVYYLAYYLPGALVGKVLGWTAANLAWEAWTQLGFLLVCCWLVAFAGVRVKWLGLLFLCFAGAEIIGLLLHNMDAALHLSAASGRPDWIFADIARWDTTDSYYVLYRSNIVHLFWTPQHLLAGWLGMALLLNRWNSQSEAVPWDGGWGGSALLGWSLLVFWSPLSALGCLPFLLALGVRESRSGRGIKAPRDSGWMTGALVVLTSALCAGIIALYLAVRTPAPVGATPQRGEHLHFLLVQLWYDEGWHALFRYGLFVLVEFGMMVALVWPRRNEKELAAWRAPLGVGVVVLLVLPCFIYGFYNDLAMRASIPATAVLCLLVAVFLQDRGAPRARRVGVLTLLALGGTTVCFYVYIVGRSLYHREAYARRPITAFPTIAAEYRDDPRHLIGQYTGPTDSPFARFLAR